MEAGGAVTLGTLARASSRGRERGRRGNAFKESGETGRFRRALLPWFPPRSVRRPPSVTIVMSAPAPNETQPAHATLSRLAAALDRLERKVGKIRPEYPPFDELLSRWEQGWRRRRTLLEGRLELLEAQLREPDPRPASATLPMAVIPRDSAEMRGICP